MTSRTAVQGWHRTLIGLLAATMVMWQASLVLAGNYRVGAVGGVVIQDDGVVQNATVNQRLALARTLRADFQRPVDAANRAVELRKVSLKALEAAIQKALAENSGLLPDEIRYLGGLQRVQYVFVYPEQQDIVLAGPAEGWKVDDYGNVIGVTTGRPVLMLDDLIVALRTVGVARDQGISCSINPTQEGMARLNNVLEAQRRSGRDPNIPALEKKMQEAFGPQVVSLTGVPGNTHLARVLVAADYRMKRLAMGLDQAEKFPSYVEMLRGATEKANTNPRWWLACNYEPVSKSEDNLAWELRGQGVKCLTEDDVLAADGSTERTGQASPIAQKWADLMTERYEELSGKEVIFGQLRNVMDLCVVAALIDQYNLRDAAGCSLGLLTDSASTELMPRHWNAPKSVPPECSFLRTSKGWTVTASGGVQIALFDVAAQVETSDAVSQVRQQAGNSSGTSWWWN